MTNSILKSYYLRRRVVSYLQCWIGTPYLWAGDDFSGFDCSGLVLEVLKSVGLVKHSIDVTANYLYLTFYKQKKKKGGAGCLVFWFKGNVAIHVEMMVDELHVVGASGGGSKTKTIADAIKHNAFVKMRPISYRGDNYKICDPFMKNKGG